MREAYDSALLLSTRSSFTVNDCIAFGSGSSYVQESFIALEKQSQNIWVQVVDVGPDALQWLKDWEPMWSDPQVLSKTTHEARAVRRHLKKIEDAA